MELVKYGRDDSRKLNAVLHAKSHDRLEVCRMHFGILRVEIPYEAPPSLQAVVSLHEAHDLGGLPEVLSEGAQMPVDCAPAQH